MGLTKATNTIIGDERARGVSGGERKRVAIGVELISNPSVLFLDEPTSGMLKRLNDALPVSEDFFHYCLGLDSFQALSVMGSMQKLAKSGRTVVASIHQPRSGTSMILLSGSSVLVN